MFEHAKKFGAEYAYGDVQEITDGEAFKTIKAGGKEYKARQSLSQLVLNIKKWEFRRN